MPGVVAVVDIGKTNVKLARRRPFQAGGGAAARDGP